MEKRTPEPSCTMMHKSFLVKLVLMITTKFPQLICVENTTHYTWGKPLIRMFLEIQCISVACIVVSQIWILSYHGETMLEITDVDITKPMVYVLAIIYGSIVHMRPSYWKVTMVLMAYVLCTYYSVMEATGALNIAMTPAFTKFLTADPENPKIWIPWALGFAFHVHVSVTSFALALIALRDLYNFDPVSVPQFQLLNGKVEFTKQPDAEDCQGTATAIHAERGDGQACNVNGGYAVSLSVV
ncbi:hypothetical protein Ocin01_03416 [Orchesella cincta]|uniref:Uncharacterized protein n=1 Tax=Orchesella cincta TaxID=48709 RepID=A0A1D2NDB9_ORCCI|nr:hypothetical protein Ocin01_03416 [Orchesella cincta]